jgi:hypothetical protein
MIDHPSLTREERTRQGCVGESARAVTGDSAPLCLAVDGRAETPARESRERARDGDAGPSLWAPASQRREASRWSRERARQTDAESAKTSTRPAKATPARDGLGSGEPARRSVGVESRASAADRRRVGREDDSAGEGDAGQRRAGLRRASEKKRRGGRRASSQRQESRTSTDIETAREWDAGRGRDRVGELGHRSVEVAGRRASSQRHESRASTDIETARERDAGRGQTRAGELGHRSVEVAGASAQSETTEGAAGSGPEVSRAPPARDRSSIDVWAARRRETRSSGSRATRGRSD